MLVLVSFQSYSRRANVDLALPSIVEVPQIVYDLEVASAVKALRQG